MTITGDVIDNVIDECQSVLTACLCHGVTF